MRIARGTALALLGAVVGIAPAAWAQGMPQGPPMPPMAARGNVTCRAVGPARGKFFIWRQRGMGGPGGGQFFYRVREGGPMGMRFGRGFGIGSRVAHMVNNPEFRQRLGITDAQAAKIRQQTTDFQIAQIHSRADLQVDALQLRNLLTAENPNRTAIDQKLDEMSAVRLAQKKQQVNYMLTLRADLTPAQRQKLRQMHEGHGRRGWRGQAAPPAAAPSSPKPNS